MGKKQSSDQPKRAERLPYGKPAIIYEGQITTRAVTGPNRPDGGVGDPTHLFGKGN